MKRLSTHLTALLLSTLLLLSSAAFAQETTIVFVNAQAAINAHPAGQTASDLQAQAREEIDALGADLQALADKANSGQQLSPDEQERYQALRSSIDAVQQRYQQEISTAVQPAIEAVNQIIREVAQENGYTLVLDGTVAGERGLGLVVYAQDGLDITDLVVERVRSLQ